MLDIIFFALIAAFIGFRIYNVLGHKNFEPGSAKPVQQSKKPQGKVIDAEYKLVKPAEDEMLDEKFGKDMADKIREINKYDPTFRVEDFIIGTKKAFEIIIKAFSSGNKDALKPLLSVDVYKNFSDEIDKRTAQSQVEETTLVAIISSTMKNIILNKKYVRIAVQVVSEQINVMRDKQGKIVGGDPSKVDRVEETWTFGRNLSSGNPNWELVETAAV